MQELALKAQQTQFDQQYVDLLMNRDPATEIHFTSHFGKILTLRVKSQIWSNDVVEDVRQETFLRVLYVLRRKSGIQSPQHLTSFVKGVCDNVLLEFFRARSFDRSELDCDREYPSTDVSVDSVLISEEQKAFIRHRLKTLSNTDQELLRQVFLEERNKDEICLKLGISRNLLRVRVHRILRRFRAAIAVAND
jgi:RNA polymerase sigma-70 factor (ECF subfamily)